MFFLKKVLELSREKKKMLELTYLHTDLMNTLLL